MSIVAIPRTEKSLHTHCVLTRPDSVTCVPAPCVASWRLASSARAAPEWIGCCVRRKCLRPCLSQNIASSSENDKHVGFGFGNVCAPHLLVEIRTSTNGTYVDRSSIFYRFISSPWPRQQLPRVGGVGPAADEGLHRRPLLPPPYYRREFALMPTGTRDSSPRQAKIQSPHRRHHPGPTVNPKAKAQKAAKPRGPQRCHHHRRHP